MQCFVGDKLQLQVTFKQPMKVVCYRFRGSKWNKESNRRTTDMTNVGHFVL